LPRLTGQFSLFTEPTSNGLDRFHTTNASNPSGDSHATCLYFPGPSEEEFAVNAVRVDFDRTVGQGGNDEIMGEVSATIFSGLNL
jgi:hypothetical protein